MPVYRSISELIGRTPLMEVTHFEQDNGLNATILAKLECFNPAGRAKDRVAKAMLDDAEQRGLEEQVARGGAGGEHIVYQKNMFSFEAGRMRHLENTLHIFETLPAGVAFCLAPGMNCTNQRVCNDFDRQSSAEPTCEPFTLIVSAPAKALLVKRNGHNQVARAEGGRLGKLQTIEKAKIVGQGKSFLVFNAVNNPLNGRTC